MHKAILACALVLVGWTATADELDFSGAGGKRLKTEVSPQGIPSVDHTTWTATCRRGIAISGHCEAHDSGFRHLQSFGSDGTHRFCKWTEPVTDATVTALYHLYGFFPGANGIANATEEQKTQLDHDGMPLPYLTVGVGGAAPDDNKNSKKRCLSLMMPPAGVRD